jgi:hypothetical protein
MQAGTELDLADSDFMPALIKLKPRKPRSYNLLPHL